MNQRTYIERQSKQYRKAFKYARTCLHDIMDAIEFVGFGENEPDYIMVNTADIELSYGGNDIDLKDIIPYIKENGEFTISDWNRIISSRTNLKI